VIKDLKERNAVVKANTVKRINQRLEMFNLFLRAARKMLEEKETGRK
jgi:hypothetical protein